jgi:hypothetical protein
MGRKRGDGAERALNHFESSGVGAAERIVQVGGVVLPGFCDAHVHLGLVDGGALVGGGIARVVDLGWNPTEVAAWARGGETGAGGQAARMPEVEFAGAFLTAEGGYPAGRSWAPDAAVRQLADAAQARAAVSEMHGHGARFAKLVLHAGDGSAAGRGEGALSDDIAGVVVDEAHRLSLEVVAHAEGPGQAERAFRLGVDRLAHTPWSERLADGLIAAMAARMIWVSTLDIHGWGEPTPEFAVALENVTRFAAAGGGIRYGTDLGNGPLPVGLNSRELDALVAAGLTGAQLLDALAPLPAREVARSVVSAPASRTLRYPEGARRPTEGVIELGAHVSWAPNPAPAATADLPEWLRTARVVAADDLEETLA